MTAMLLRLHQRFHVRPLPGGRWGVMHQLPGTGAWAVDEDCPTLHSAELAAAWREHEHQQEQQRLRAERALLWRTH